MEKGGGYIGLGVVLENGVSELSIPNVVPALCMVYFTLLFLSRRWTAATSLDTEAEGVPIGMRQKSA